MSGQGVGAPERLAAAIRPHPHRGDLIAAGAVPLTLAIAMIDVRMRGTWGAGALFGVDALGCALVLGMALLAQREPERPRAYQSVLLVAGLTLLAFALYRLARVIGADHLSAGVVTWTVPILLAVAAYAARRFGSVVMTFVAALAAGVFGIAFVQWAFDPHGPGTFRWVLLLEMLGFVVAHLRLRDAAQRHSVAFVDAAGVTVLAQAVLLGGAVPFFAGDVGWGWGLVVLAGALGLIAYACVDRERSAAYLGFFALVLFAASEGMPHDGDGATLVGWPLLLLVVGGVAVGFGLRPLRPLPPEPSTGPDAPTVAVTPAEAPTEVHDSP